MERYSEWRDARTGIHPFVPPSAPHSGPRFPAFVLHGLPAFFLCLARIPFALACLLHVAILISAAEYLPCGLVAYPRRLLLRYLHAVGLRVALFILGIHRISVAWERIRLPVLHKEQKANFYAPGTVIIANRQSFLDVLILAARFSPVFVLPVVNSNGDLCVERAFVPALLDALFDRRFYYSAENADKLFEPLAAIALRARACRAPVVLFPEGATTNGRAVLGPASPAVLDAVPAGGPAKPGDNQVAIVCVKYAASPDGSTLSGSLRHPVLQLLQVCARPNTPVELRFLSPLENSRALAAPAVEVDTATVVAGKNTNTTGAAMRGAPSEDLAHTSGVSQTFVLMRLLAQAGKMRLVALTAKDKENFLRKWHGEQRRQRR